MKFSTGANGSNEVRQYQLMREEGGGGGGEDMEQETGNDVS